MCASTEQNVSTEADPQGEPQSDVAVNATTEKQRHPSNENRGNQRSLVIHRPAPGFPVNITDYELPKPFQKMKETAEAMRSRCRKADNKTKPYPVDLVDFGIIEALNNYRPKSRGEQQRGECRLPPPTECDVETFSIVVMGYCLDRRSKLKWEIWQMLEGHYGDLVEEVILIWNNNIPLDTGSLEKGDGNYEAGREIVAFDRDRTYGDKFKVWYPLLDLFANDLFNRYHPELAPRSKAVLFFDDDGPYPVPDALNAGFELWKRNSNAQVGDLGRNFKMGKRQNRERWKLVGRDVLNDRELQSHCRSSGDILEYNFAVFPPFFAHMVLPSGSFLHKDFLCWLWHPVLEEIRKFVRDHPVHPDDVAVSAIITQLTHRSPVTYPLRINIPEANRSDHRRRRLLWQEDDQWSDKRSLAVNSVVSYLGSVGTGSAIGWCSHNPYYNNRTQTCSLKMPTSVEMISWMKPGGYMANICPKPPRIIVDKVKLMQESSGV